MNICYTKRIGIYVACRFIILCFFTMAIQHSSQAQTLSKEDIVQYANKLFDKQILNKKGKEELINTVEYDIQRSVQMSDPPAESVSKTKKGKVTKVDILGFCAKAFINEMFYRIYNKEQDIERKIKQEDPPMKQGWTVYPPRRTEVTDFIAPTRSAYGSTKTRTLHDFFELGLINEMLFNEATRQLQALKIRNEGELLTYLYDRASFYANYDRLKTNQLEYLKKIFDNGLMTSDRYNQLINSYKPYEIKDRLEIMGSCQNAMIIDLKAYSANPQVTYPAIFDSVKKLVPNWNFSDLKVKTIKKPVDDLIEIDVQISFRVDSSKYTNRFFQDFIQPDPKKRVLADANKISNNFHKGINKYLADIGSEYRLHFILSPDENNPYGQQQFGLILLKRGQRELFGVEPYFLTEEVYDEDFTSKKVKLFVDQLKANNFFTHLSKKELTTGFDNLASKEIYSNKNILECFPKTIVMFDWETGNLENPYEQHLNEFKEASRGAFQPSAIVDEYKKGWDTEKKIKAVKFGFTLNNKRYEKDLKFEGDWLDPDFLELIKQALKENNIDGNIYYCIDNGQESGYVFLSASQLRFIKVNYPDLLKE